MDWLSESKFIFVSSVNEDSGGDYLVQVALIFIAAIFGALASYVFNQVEVRRVRRAKLNSLAISSMRKVSSASSSLLAIQRSFLSGIPEVAEPADYWKFVKTPVSIPPRMELFTDDEFEFLLGENDTDDLAHRLMEFLNFVNINEATLDTYSQYREILSGMLALHSGPIDIDDGSSTTEINFTDNPHVAIKMYETSNLCIQLYENTKEAIVLGKCISQEFNTALPKLTDNPNFAKRLVFDF
jgi:hypothetical protein